LFARLAVRGAASNLWEGVGFLYTVIHNRAIYRWQPADLNQEQLIGRNLACLAGDRTG